MEEANAFLSVKAQTSKTIAYAAFLCILSPIVLFLLNAISGSKAGALNEDAAVGIGMIVLILLLAAAAVYTAYWFVATAVYLGYSLWSNTWGRSWIIWVIAGVLFPAVLAITSAFEKKTK